MTILNNTTWVVGTPRTGSMLTYNLVKEIFNSEGYCALPKKMVKSDKEKIDMYKKTSLRDLDEKNKYVLKVHSILRSNLPKSKFIVNIRNPFDICASFFEFMKCECDSAIKVAKAHWDVIEHYKSFDDSAIFFIRYEKLELEPIKVITELSKFLGVELNLRCAKKISKKFDKHAVKKIIIETENKLKAKMENQKKILPDELVKISGNNYRALDLTTGFQTRHISNRKSGEWKKVFVDKEIPKVIVALNDVAVKLGYEREVY